MQRRKVDQWLVGVAMLAVALNLLPSIAQACAVCWGADDALAHGLNVSVLFMMAMPFMIGGSIIGVLFMAQKHAKASRHQSSNILSAQ